MARLTEEQKRYVVWALACYRTPSEVVEAVKEIFGVEVTPQAVQHYDPTVPSTKTAKKWEQLFWATRRAYLEESAQVGIAQPRYRMERYEEILRRALKMGQHGNLVLALNVMEQAAKEQGGIYTNKYKVETSGVDIDMDDLTDAELTRVAAGEPVLKVLAETRGTVVKGDPK